jgi:hypothetical protein
MSDPVDREALKANYTRRLQKLQERRALLGFAAHPSIDLEIEEIQLSLRSLDAQEASATSHVLENETGAASRQPNHGPDSSAPATPASGDTTIHNSAAFYGSVGNVHQGSGDINVYGDQQDREIVPEWRIGLLRRGVRDHAPPDLAEAAQLRVNSLEDAIRRHDADDAEDALRWLQRRMPALASQVHELRRHLSDMSA